MSIHSEHHYHHHDALDGEHCHFDETPHDTQTTMKKLTLAFWVTAPYFFIELWGGWQANSLSLLADAGHMFADLGAILLALFAAWFSTQQASPQKTYGNYRMEVLAAFINGLILAGASVLIVQEAWHRWHHPADVQANTLLWIAVLGLIVNIVVVKILHHHHDHDDLNLKSAYLHVLGDLLGSVGAITAGIVIRFTHWTWIDPLVSVLIAALVLHSAWRLIWDAADVLMEHCPSHIDPKAVEASLLTLSGVTAVHDLHIWTIASAKYALSAHVTVEEAAFIPETLNQLQTHLNQAFGLNHVTIQLEPPGFSPIQCPSCSHHPTPVA